MNPDLMGKVAQSAADRLAVLFDRMETGEIDRDRFVTLAVAVLGVSRARAVALADVAAAAEMTRATGSVVAPLGLSAPAIVGTAALAVVATREAAEVEGRAQTLTASQDAHTTALRTHGAKGWTRVLNAGACPLCVDLAGETLPMSANPWHHKGCGCSTRPVTTERDST